MMIGIDVPEQTARTSRQKHLSHLKYKFQMSYHDIPLFFCFGKIIFRANFMIFYATKQTGLRADIILPHYKFRFKM